MNIDSIMLEDAVGKYLNCKVTYWGRMASYACIEETPTAHAFIKYDESGNKIITIDSKSLINIIKINANSNGNRPFPDGNWGGKSSR